MYVCVCHGLNDRQVRAAIDEGGAGSPAQVYQHYECKPRCGKCVPFVREMVKAAKAGQIGCGRCGDACECSNS